MRAVVWHGKEDVGVDDVPDPALREPTDAIVRITSTAICGSDLHLYAKFPRGVMREGDILGHEPMGVVEEAGSATHVVPLEQAPTAYEMFQEKRDGAIKVVLRP